MDYVLPPLPFAYDALEPYIDRQTMKVHHDAHHKTYVDKLNAALRRHPECRKPVEELLASLDTLPTEIRTAVANNGGGHENHTLFWSLLSPRGEREPLGDLGNVLKDTFGSFNGFQEKLTKTAVEHFSNGWAWLCTDSKGKLSIFSTKDHESPLGRGLTPLLVVDIWEHAYYLRYQNRRPDYLEAFWKVINWREVDKRWTEFKQNGTTSREWRIAS